ncbi:MAG: phosphomethylpyrimidine synthase ThiC [Desulfarculaceae bacterium]|nr:phosphomethylpyrimidine synthase ThiC [Desulfarculaceae bacterium]MCF8072878.1 phosphomethylpyrimidine synthase ThiC [Desulfarculaceae bacterium]MCF8101046.1 phosphomethylpyrimidine synthase ThiC [Desulfarculaceae bacterium]MCF8115567.1 phosphomethylpyrimidine synthase ThiC [Desulfarculaceae bacterium]
MATQVELAAAGQITPQMKQIALDEGLAPELVRQRFAGGQIVAPVGANHKHSLVGLGQGLATKVNASIGTSTDIVDIEAEVSKALAAQAAGADTLMELSVGGDLDRVRREVLAAVELPVGNVPLYQAFGEAKRRYGDPNKLDEELLFELIERQCADGISFMAVHCGINLYTIERLEKQNYRYGGLVSKGGASMVAWMKKNNRENPLYARFDRVVEILKKYDVVLSLGNGLRAGAIHDSFDRAMVQELLINCELAQLGREMGCQMLVEGPGHVPLDQIEANIILQKRMSDDAPYYMLGPIPSDVTASHDHITAAIGAAQSARYGADLICYITPAEHLALPDEQDVIAGVKAARTAAYIGDTVKYPQRGRARDLAMSKARRDSDWEQQYELALFSQDAKAIRAERSPADSQVCTMCGEFCANRGGNQVFGHLVEGTCKA